jgi:hypothetical protein
MDVIAVLNCSIASFRIDIIDNLTNYQYTIQGG